MNTTFRFASAQEITPTILTYQIEEVKRRDELMVNRLDCFLDCDATFAEFDKELETICCTFRKTECCLSTIDCQ